MLVILLNLTPFLGLDGQDWLEEITLSCMLNQATILEISDNLQYLDNLQLVVHILKVGKPSHVNILFSGVKRCLHENIHALNYRE